MTIDHEMPRAPLPPSPCVGICALKGDHCYGCGRTSDEIAAWGTLSPSAQSAVWAELPGRLAAFGFKVFRLAAGSAVVAKFIGRTFTETSGHWRIVSPAVETAMQISEGDRPETIETDEYVMATASNGDWLRLLKHPKVRIFGFASGDGKAGMDTVVLVLPKGRAQRDLEASDDVLPNGYVAVEGPDAFTEVLLKPENETDTIAGLTGQAWDVARAQLPNELSAGNARLNLRNALGGMETLTPQFAETPPAPEANAPADVKISRAFVAGAIFRADDPDWLAAALAP